MTDVQLAFDTRDLARKPDTLKPETPGLAGPRRAGGIVRRLLRALRSLLVAMLVLSPTVLAAVYFGLVAPAGTPKPIIDKIREDVARIGNDPAFRKKQFTDRALEPILNTPEEFARFLVADRATSERVVREAGLTPQ